MRIRLDSAMLAVVLFAAAGPAYSQQGLPAWPQQFQVRGPESASYGFAVTQPGPVAVEVRWQGPPLRITLQGPNRVEQTGLGRVVLNYQVTPQDVQRDVLWTVSVSLQNPGPAPAAGQIGVQYPPADAAVGQRAAQVRKAAFSRQQAEQVGPLMEARVEQVITARKSEFAQNLARRDQAERLKTQTMVNQVRGAGISSRAVPSGRLGAPVGVAPIAQLSRIPPPQISALSANSGGPRSGLTINGSGFGTAGRVYLSIPAAWVPPCMNCLPTDVAPDKARPATIVRWSDTEIIAELPDLIGVPRYQAEVFVHRDQVPSNRLPFDFVPGQELRIIRSYPSSDQRHSQSLLTFPTADLPKSAFSHWRLPVPFGEFVGEKGNDEFFLITHLQNGWTMAGVDFFGPADAIHSMGSASSEFRQAMGLLGGAYIQEQRGGDHPYINVRWWLNPFREFVPYRYAIHIVGPAGVPDGVVMP